MATKKKAVVVKKEFNELKTIGESYTREQKDFILKSLVPGLNDNELLLFLYKAKKLGLNPLQGEITAHSRETKLGRKLVVIIGKDGKARNAMQTGLVEYVKVEAIYTKKTTTHDEVNGEITETVRCEPWEGGTLWGAVAEVKRKNVKKPFVVALPASEYQSGELVKYLPSTMIKKTALSQCYTMAFPDLFAGVYVEEELPTIMGESKSVEIEGGDKPANERQIATLKSLGAENTEEEFGKMTNQEASDYIKRLSMEKK